MTSWTREGVEEKSEMRMSTSFGKRDRGRERTRVGNNMEICYRETGDNLRLAPRANFVPPRRAAYEYLWCHKF